MRKMTEARGHTSKKNPLENLRLAVHGVAAPFSCAGAVVADRPVELVFKDRTRFAAVRAASPWEQKDLLTPLLDHCKAAPFGDGKKTRYDRRVRDALQLQAAEGGFTVTGFAPESSGILAQVQRTLVPHDQEPISAELYSVNVYTAGGHFAPHKDTPRGSDMLGTLVVCLPSQFLGGELVLTHSGIVHTFDWGSTVERHAAPNQLQWVAFFGDVDHEIKQVRAGARVTLTYLLRRSSEQRALERSVAAVERAPRVQEAWQTLLADKQFLRGGGVVGYPCCHLYHQDARFQRAQRQLPFDMLKGRDQLVAATAVAAGLQVEFHPYLFENCVNATWQLARFPNGKDTAKLRWQMDEIALERALPIRASAESDDDFGVTWLEPPPSSGSAAQTNEATDPELPAAARLHSCDWCPWGYFGNESSEVDFYTFAALHIVIPKVGAGPRAVAKAPKRTPAKRRRPPRKG